MTDIGFDGKVAIVTGAGGGLGREHALEFARRGAHVVVNDLGGSVGGDDGDGGNGGDIGPAEKVAHEIRDAGGEAVADNHSVATTAGGAAIVQTAVDAYGTVDILVNNAGILRDKSFHNLTPELLQPVIDVHLLGAFNVTQPAWLIMRDKNYGRIVNTSSASGILGNFGQANYGAAKMGVVGLTRVLAIEGRRNNIRVNAISPVARTRMTEELMGDGAWAESLDPALVSPLVMWLAHEEVDVTGEVYSAAGGVIARFFFGLTAGYHKPDLKAEDVRDHFAEIRDETGYQVFEDSGGEIGKLYAILAADT